jgi:hypothetical protein
LAEVVAHQREQRGVGVLLEAALHKVRAAITGRGDVRDADDSAHALAIKDTLLSGHGPVVTQLDALADLIAAPAGLGDCRRCLSEAKACHRPPAACRDFLEKRAAEGDRWIGAAGATRAKEALATDVTSAL